MIQFPWRLLGIIILCFSIIGGIHLGTLIDLIIIKFKNKKNVKLLSIPFLIIYILSCLYSLSFVKNLDFKDIDNSHYTEKEIIDTNYKVSRYSSDNTTLEVPFLFYKGYVVKYKSYDSDEVSIIKCNESEHGLVQIDLATNVNGYFEVSYHTTKLHKICIGISSITFISYLIYILYKKIKFC